MLAELLLVLAGHPSSLFIPNAPCPSPPTTLVTSPHLAEYLHPGEIASLNTLAQLAFRYRKVRAWATSTQQRGRDALLAEALTGRSGKGKARVIDDAPGVYLSTLASSLLDVLREYDVRIVETEARILALDPELVQDGMGYVPLSSVVATFDDWQAPMAALEHMVDIISAPSSSLDSAWAPGRLLDFLHNSTQTGNPRLRGIFTAILKSVETLWLTHLSAFLLSGHAPSTSTPSNPAIALDVGSDPLSPQHRIYRLEENMYPSCIPAATRESILFVGRVAATLRREGRILPAVMIEGLRGQIMGGGIGEGLEEAIKEARAEIGEWLWKHILTGTQVIDALEAFGDYFLTRNGEFTLSIIREVHRLRLTKLVTANPHSSSSVIREQDLNTALLRASVGTSAETDKALEDLSWKMEGGPLRPMMPSLSASTAKPKRMANASLRPEGSVRDLFSSSLLGTPLVLDMKVGWPLDLFMTTSTISAYADIHAYLVALRDTQLRVLDCWTSLSASQRHRRKWTGVTEGGTREEALTRRNLARAAWGTIRAMLFFLDALQNHFMMDIIDVQQKRFLEELESVGSSRQGWGGGSLPGSLRGSLRGSMRTESPSGRRGHRLTASVAAPAGWHDLMPSPASESVPAVETRTFRSKAAPTPRKTQASYLDFLTLRQMHARHLSFLREGLLISDGQTAGLVRDILDVCKRLTGSVVRWGGDVLPELLVEGAAGEEVGEMVAHRAKLVEEINETLHELLSEFFRALLDSQTPVSTTDGSISAVGASFSRTARAMQLSRAVSRQVSFSAAGRRAGVGKTKADLEREERGLEAEALMGRHVEQLLLRLDFNGVLTEWVGKEDLGAAGINFLADVDV